MRRGVPPLPAVPEMPELGYDSDGQRRFIKAPFPLTLELIQDEFGDLKTVELGRALKLGAYWWFWGELPRSGGMYGLLGLQGAKAREALDAVAHHFAPGSTLAAMREAEIARARRRYKLDVPPKPPAVVLPFPGRSPKA